jgi:hypothetical protein
MLHGTECHMQVHTLDSARQYFHSGKMALHEYM